MKRFQNAMGPVWHLLRHIDNIHNVNLHRCGPGSSVAITTDYGLGGPGTESRCGKIFHRPDRPWEPPNLLYNGYRVFPGGRKRPGVTLNPHPLLVPRSKSRVELYLYSPKGLRGL